MAAADVLYLGNTDVQPLTGASAVGGNARVAAAGDGAGAGAASTDVGAANCASRRRAFASMQSALRMDGWLEGGRWGGPLVKV